MCETLAFYDSSIYKLDMAYLMREYRDLLLYGSSFAENIVSKETDWNAKGAYDVQSLDNFQSENVSNGVFAQLFMIEPKRSALDNYYLVNLQDCQIFNFVRNNPQVDLLSLITFIMTHELLHIQRFSTGKADFYGDTHTEEVVVDTLTRLFLARNPVTGLKKILTVLDNIEATPLYNDHIVNDQGRLLHAYLRI